MHEPSSLFCICKIRSCQHTLTRFACQTDLFSAPKFEAPKFDAPKFEAPKFDAPKMPAMSIPSFDAPKSSGGYDFDAPTTAVEEFEPQEIRDERAKAAATVFNEADSEAKVCGFKLVVVGL